MAMINEPTAAREQQILDAIIAGRFEHSWSTIISEARGHRAEIQVSTDALKVDGVRVAATAATAQRIADRIGASLPTFHICDMTWEQARMRTAPQIQAPTATMGYWDAIMRHDRMINEAPCAWSDATPGLHRNVGKAWILSDRIVGDMAVNYGWYDNKAPYTSWSGFRMWQTLGTRHNVQHVDYSQTLTFVRDTLLVDGTERKLVDVMVDSELSFLVNAEGVMRVLRMPTVPLNRYVDWPLPTATPLDFRARCVAWSMAEMVAGVCEIPNGSNDSPRIREYFSTPDFQRAGQPIRVNSLPWCAVATCMAHHECSRLGDHPPQARLSGIELETDAIDQGKWSQTPVVGDVAIFTRGGQAWERHVARVIRVVGNSFSTIGGNENNRWGITPHHVTDPDLRGFIGVA